MKQILLLITILGLLFSCGDSRLFESKVDFKQKFWHKDSVIDFSFDISDRSVPYNIFFTLRNTGKYNFSNIYIRYVLLNEIGDTVNAELKNFYLFNPKTGQPFGSGFGDIFEHKLILSDTVYFETPGEYSVLLQQYMRRDSLREIFSTGIRLEIVK